MFVYELNGCGFEFRCSHLKTSDFVPVSSKEFLDIQATIECGFTLKRVCDMIRTYSQMHRTDKYSQYSSVIWPVWLNIPTVLENLQIGPNNWKTSKACKKNPTKSKKIVKHSSKPCSIEKWVFQSTRLKRTKRPRPKSNIPASLKNPQICPNNWKKSKVCKKTPTKSKKK